MLSMPLTDRVRTKLSCLLKKITIQDNTCTCRCTCHLHDKSLGIKVHCTCRSRSHKQHRLLTEQSEGSKTPTTAIKEKQQHPIKYHTLVQYHYQHEFNENPMSCSGKTHESFFMVMNFAIVTFMALVQGHKFSMNYIDLSFTQPMKKVHGHLCVGVG